jgi:soluble P-type ATPase
MMKLEIPGKGLYEVENVILDFNGTIAKDGRIHNKVKDRISLLGKKVKVYILTADTRGDVEEKVKRLPVQVVRLEAGDEAIQKLNFLREIGPEKTIAVGNGYNDHLMLKEALLGIAVIGPEGASKEAILNADVVVTDPLFALDFILKPLRHKATLRR